MRMYFFGAETDRCPSSHSRACLWLLRFDSPWSVNLHATLSSNVLHAAPAVFRSIANMQTCENHAGHPSQTLLSWVTMLWKASLQHASLGPGKSADSIPRQPSDSSDYKAKSLKGTQTWARLSVAKGISTEPCQETINARLRQNKCKSHAKNQTNLGFTVFLEFQLFTESQLRSWPWSSV